MELYRTILDILGIKIELLSNMKLDFFQNYFSFSNVESLHSDFGKVSLLDQDEDACIDGRVILFDQNDTTEINITGNVIVASGPFVQMEREMSDKRYTLLGNQGLLYRFILAMLEKKSGIFSFHANALYSENSHELTIFLGGAASGKSPALLAGVCRGLKVFGTELVHFSVKAGQVAFYRSACLDNIRLECLHNDFPELCSLLQVPTCEGFSSPSSKFLLDLRKFAAPDDVILDPKLRLIMPKVEMGRSPVITDLIKDKEVMSKLLFDNLSEKISPSFTLYNKLAVSGIDTPKRADSRLHAAKTLIRQAALPYIENIISPPRYYLEVL